MNETTNVSVVAGAVTEENQRTVRETVGAVAKALEPLWTGVMAKPSRDENESGAHVDFTRVDGARLRVYFWKEYRHRDKYGNDAPRLFMQVMVPDVGGRYRGGFRALKESTTSVAWNRPLKALDKVMRNKVLTCANLTTYSEAAKYAAEQEQKKSDTAQLAQDLGRDLGITFTNTFWRDDSWRGNYGGIDVSVENNAIRFNVRLEGKDRELAVEMLRKLLVGLNQ